MQLHEYEASLFLKADSKKICFNFTFDFSDIREYLIIKYKSQIFLVYNV